MNITAKTRSTMPNTPTITFVKNKAIITTAAIILSALSIVPMFFFIILVFKIGFKKLDLKALQFSLIPLQ
jgi:hypothetical protein